jgi:uncharacterized surface protein with fasciclin (FAS1) repeats
MRKIISMLGITALLLSVSSVFAQSDAPMVHTETISRYFGSINDYMMANTNMAGSTANQHCYTAANDSGSDFDCLAQALKATGLNDVLAGEGPFTVFAPTDAAFEALASSMSASEFQALFSNSEALKPILLYHVVAQDLTLNDLWYSARGNAGNTNEMTVQGSHLIIHFFNRIQGDMTTTVTLGADAAMLEMDNSPHVVGGTLQLNNGVIIPIDAVLALPAN